MYLRSWGLFSHIGIFKSIYLVALGLSCGTQERSLWSIGFSSCITQAYLPHGTWDPSSPTRDRTCLLCLGRWLPHHWSTRKSLHWDLFWLGTFLLRDCCGRHGGARAVDINKRHRAPRDLNKAAWGSCLLTLRNSRPPVLQTLKMTPCLPPSLEDLWTLGGGDGSTANRLRTVQCGSVKEPQLDFHRLDSVPKLVSEKCQRAFPCCQINTKFSSEP